jgi:hypothetical protein
MMEALDSFARRVVRPKVAEAALRIVLAETSAILDLVGEFNKLEPEVRAAVDLALGAKGKAIVGILEELAALEGLSIGADWGHELSTTICATRRHRSGLPNSRTTDTAVLAKVYDLARRIRVSEDARREGTPS